jgi:hypothetical protein
MASVLASSHPTEVLALQRFPSIVVTLVSSMLVA